MLDLGICPMWQIWVERNVGSWDVSSVTDMNHMFALASTLYQCIGAWDVSGVTGMPSMFWGASIKIYWIVGRVQRGRNELACSKVQYVFLTETLVLGLCPMCRTCVPCSWLHLFSTKTLYFGMYPEWQSLEKYSKVQHFSTKIYRSLGCVSGATSFNKDIRSWYVSRVICPFVDHQLHLSSSLILG
jgi:Mycoplasma protein of unknown function, DUF285